MKPDAYKLIERCIEDGLLAGYHRAHKHNDRPTPEDICESQRQYIMAEIAEWFALKDRYK